MSIQSLQRLKQFHLLVVLVVDVVVDVVVEVTVDEDVVEADSEQDEHSEEVHEREEGDLQHEPVQEVRHLHEQENKKYLKEVIKFYNTMHNGLLS